MYEKALSTKLIYSSGVRRSIIASTKFSKVVSHCQHDFEALKHLVLYQNSLVVKENFAFELKKNI